MKNSKENWASLDVRETSILEMVTFRNGTLTKKCSLRRFNIIVATQQRILTLPLKQ